MGCRSIYPRSIGSSLCWLFVQIHGRMFPSTTKGEGMEMHGVTSDGLCVSVGGGHGWLVRFFSFLLETHQVGFDPLLGSNGGRVLIRSERGERTVERTILYVRQPTPPHTCTPVSYPLDPHVVRRTSLLVDRPGHVPERYDTNATTGTNKTKEKETSVGSTTNPNRKRKKKEQEGAFRRTGGCRERQIGVLHDWRKHHQVVGARTWMRGA